MGKKKESKPREYRNNNASERVPVKKVSKPTVGRFINGKFVEDVEG